jgi:hypothetical protein
VDWVPARSKELGRGYTSRRLDPETVADTRGPRLLPFQLLLRLAKVVRMAKADKEDEARIEYVLLTCPPAEPCFSTKRHPRHHQQLLTHLSPSSICILQPLSSPCKVDWKRFPSDGPPWLVIADSRSRSCSRCSAVAPPSTCFSPRCPTWAGSVLLAKCFLPCPWLWTSSVR